MSLLLSHNSGNTVQRLITSADKGKVLRTGIATSGYLRCPAITAFDSNTDFTFRVKFKWDGISPSTIVSKGGTSGDLTQWLLTIESGTFYAYTSNGSGGTLFNMGLPTANVWTDLIYSRQGNTLKLSIDGAAYTTNTFTGTASTSITPLCFGGPVSGSSTFQGVISRATTWNSALTVSDVVNNTGGALTTLIADYLLDGDANDSSIAARHGSIFKPAAQGNTIATTPTFIGDISPYNSTLSQRLINNTVIPAQYLMGTANAVGTYRPPLSNFTVEWTGRIIGVSQRMVNYSFSASDGWKFDTTTLGSDTVLRFTTPGIKDYIFTNITSGFELIRSYAITFTSGGNVTLFIDGVNIQTVTGSSPAAAVPAGTYFRLGNLNVPTQDCRVWNTVLSDATILAWYNKRITNAHPNYTANLEAYFPIDNIGGTSTSTIIYIAGVPTTTTTSGHTFTPSYKKLL